MKLTLDQQRVAVDAFPPKTGADMKDEDKEEKKTKFQTFVCRSQTDARVTQPLAKKFIKLDVEVCHAL